MQKKDFLEGLRGCSGFDGSGLFWRTVFGADEYCAALWYEHHGKNTPDQKTLDTYYVEDYDKELARTDVYRSGSRCGRSYTYYLSADSLAEQMEKNSGHFVGIGVEIYAGDDGYIVVSSVTPGGLRKRQAFWQRTKSQKWMERASLARQQQMFPHW